MAAVQDGVTGRVRVLWMWGCDHVRPVGMQNTGKVDRRRDIRGVGIGEGGT